MPQKNKGDLEKYFNKDLLMFVKDVTQIGLQKKEKILAINMYIVVTVHSHKIKCMMVCAIMANMTDTRSCFLQTLIGLAMRRA